MATLRPEHGQVEVVLDREPQEKPRSLRGSGQPGAGAKASGLMGDVSAEELDRAFRRGELAGNHVEQGRLAGSVRAEDGPSSARLDHEGDIRPRSQSAEPPADPPQVE